MTKTMSECHLAMLVHCREESCRKVCQGRKNGSGAHWDPMTIGTWSTSKTTMSVVSASVTLPVATIYIR